MPHGEACPMMKHGEGGGGKGGSEGLSWLRLLQLRRALARPVTVSPGDKVWATKGKRSVGHRPHGGASTLTAHHAPCKPACARQPHTWFCMRTVPHTFLL